MKNENFNELKIIASFANLLYSLKTIHIWLWAILISILCLYLSGSVLTTIHPKQIDASDQISKKLDQQFVAVTGKLAINKTIADPFIQGGDIIVLGRKVEMFSWHENTEYIRDPSGLKDPNGLGFAYIDTLYYYHKEWADSIPNSMLFNQSGKYTNRQTTEFLDDVQIADLRIGNYSLNADYLNLSWDSKWINITKRNIKQLNGCSIHNDFYIFKGAGTFDNPQIGDIRLSYWALELLSDSLTVLGKFDFDKSKLTPYKTYNGSAVYGILYSEGKPMIKDLAYKKSIEIGILKDFVAFMVAWFSVYMIISPVSLFRNQISTNKIAFVTDVKKSGIIASVVFIIVRFIKYLFYGLN